jgi:Uma2 family endonuclease
MKQAPFTAKRWRRVEYERLVDVGVFEGEPLELIGGQLIVAEPKGPPHATIVARTAAVLRRVFGDEWFVRQQDPIALDEASEPEPDVVVVPGRDLDYFDDHPARPVLVVEVAETSLYYDRGRKSSAYARAGLPDYWIVNLVQRQLEVYRDPVAEAGQPFDSRYNSRTILDPSDTVTPLAAPQERITVADVLP